MKAIPLQNVVLCKLLNKQKDNVVENGIAYNKENMLIYQIIDIGVIPDDSRLKVGDKIISNSIPTKIILDDKDYYLVKYEYIAGKIVEE